MKSSLLLFLLASILGFAVRGQSLPAALFQATPPPKMASKEWFKLNYGTAYAVENVNGKLVISLAKAPRAETELKTAQGTFRGFDHGEYGGGLLFYAARGSKQPDTVKVGNVCFLYQQAGQVYFLEGLAHMDYQHGALYQVTGSAPPFGYTLLASLDDAPEAVARVGNDLYLAQSSGFTVVRNLQPEVVLARTFWAGLYPNSVAVLDAATVFIGLRGGYVRLNPTTKEFTLFTPKL